MKAQVHVCQDAEALAAHAAQWIVDLIGRHEADPEIDWPFSLALAGGTTPKAMYQAMAAMPAGKIAWERIILLWGDERHVPPEHPDSNYRMVKEALLDHIDIPAENVLAVPEPGGDATLAARNYERVLKETMHGRNRKFPKVDCILLGLGKDVHTASLFPHTSALKEKSKLVTANEVPQLDTTRITFTPPMINAARNIAFIINGAEKMDALSILWHGPRDTQQYPAQLIQPTDGSLHFFLDKHIMGNIPLPESVMVQLI
ncbi:MAG: 6-phosphogluconolactonase [Pirellulaceae bacterium]